jgi:hypothetical protein
LVSTRAGILVAQTNTTSGGFMSLTVLAVVTGVCFAGAIAALTIGLR